MNLEEAKKIIKLTENGASVMSSGYSEADFWMANGYIQAIHGPEVKILLDALEYYKRKDNGIEKSLPGVVVPRAYQALAMFKAITQVTVNDKL